MSEVFDDGPDDAGRYTMTKRLARIAMLSLSISAVTPACSGFLAQIRDYEVRHEALRGTLRSYSGEQLHLRVGRTTIARTLTRLEARGVTGFEVAAQADLQGNRITALTGNYQTYVHLFTNELYSESLELRVGDVVPYHPVPSFVLIRGRVRLSIHYHDTVGEMARINNNRHDLARSNLPRTDRFVEGADGRFVFVRTDLGD